MFKTIPLSNGNSSSSSSSSSSNEKVVDYECQARICMTFQDLNYWPEYNPNLLDENDGMK